MYRLRDERGVYSDIWASGLMRRARARRRPQARRQPAGSTRPTTSSTPVLEEMCSLLPVRARARPPTSSRPSVPSYRATPLAPRTPSLDTRRSRPHLLRTRPACPRPSARLMRATGIAMGEAVRQLRGRARRGSPVRGFAASQGVYEGPRALRRRPCRVRPDRRRATSASTESTTEAFNILLPLLGRDRHRQRRPTLALGHRRARVRDPRCGRDAGGHRADPGRRPRPGRRGRRRSDGARREGAVPLAEARDTSVFGSKAVGLGEASRHGLPVPPGIALSGPIVEAVAIAGRAGDRKGSQAVRNRCRCRSRPARRPSTRTAPTPVSPGSM